LLSILYIQKAYPEVIFHFTPSKLEKKVFTVDKLSLILPNFHPKPFFCYDDPYSFKIELYKSDFWKNKFNYIAVYYQTANHLFDYGQTMAILEYDKENDIIKLSFKFFGFGEQGIRDIKFIDFDNDGNKDIFVVYGTEDGHILYLYLNHRGSFYNNVLYFTDLYSDDEFYLHGTGHFNNFQLTDIDNDKICEFIIETDKYKRTYKWGEGAFILKEKIERKKEDK
jgi:hypothetical protein